jgi:hypothetical protein
MYECESNKLVPQSKSSEQTNCVHPVIGSHPSKYKICLQSLKASIYSALLDKSQLKSNRYQLSVITIPPSFLPPKVIPVVILLPKKKEPDNQSSDTTRISTIQNIEPRHQFLFLVKS